MRLRALPAARCAAIVLACAPLAAAEAQAPQDIVRALTGIEASSAGAGLRTLILVGIFGLAPSAILLTTCYPRIFIVLSFLRRALGTADIPSNGLLAGLALLLTVVTMLPVWKRVHDEAYVPLSRGEMTANDAVERASAPIRKFMLAHTLEKDLRLILESTGTGVQAAAGGTEGTGGTGSAQGSIPGKVEDLGFFVILPAFVLSELRTAFEIGFLLFLPFLVIDLAVSAVLISMGMFMLPPVFVSLPLKVLVFVLVDGWNLVVSQIIQGVKVLV
jgi:flagellar biosynthetic protein FliP